jgi:hypothetical protein
MTVSAPGVLTVSGNSLESVRQTVDRAGGISVPLKLTEAGRRALRRSIRRRLVVRVRVRLRAAGAASPQPRTGKVLFELEEKG